MKRTLVMLAVVTSAACGGAVEQPEVAGAPDDSESATAEPSKPPPDSTSARGVTPATGAEEASPAATSPSPAETATPRTTSTPSPEPPPPASQPPAATVSGEAGSRIMERGSYCWSDDSGAGLCADTVGPNENTPSFATVTGETLTLAFDIESAPTSVEIMTWPVDDRQHSTETTLRAANPTSYEVDLEAGSYYAVLLTDWEQGDASYHVRLDVS